MFMMRADISNPQVGELIGLDYSTVSRIRSGTRHPSIAVMLQIERAFDWSIKDQAEARQRGDYHELFESVLAKKHGVVPPVA